MADLVLPQNVEAEEAVLAAIITSERALQVVSEQLDARHFYRGGNQEVYRAILKLQDSGIPIDLISLVEHLELTGQLVAAGGKDRIVQITSGYPTVTNVDHHAQIIRDYAVRRDLISVGQDVARSGWEPDGPLDAMLGRAEEAIYGLTTSHETGELRPIRETLPHTYETLSKPGGVITGTPLGITALDSLTGGFQPGNLILLAARPGMGKSALAIGACIHNAVQKQNPVAIFTLEMSAEEINQRILSQMTGVGLMNLRTRRGLTLKDRDALQQVKGVLLDAPLYVDDTVSARLLDIRARSRRLKSRIPSLSLIVIDYLQLMLTDGRSENRNLEVAAISRGLKLLARELEIPVVALSQLSRGVEQRHDKTPMLSDLRDSGALEQDADLVFFIHRDKDAETANVTLAKHRNGPTGAEEIAWLKERAQFREIYRGAHP